jgi:anaerobic ribonucleoside-triphosphate reductase
MNANLPGYLNKKDIINSYPGSGHGFVNKNCPICGNNRQSKAHRATKYKCSRELQKRGFTI